jgi:hypothetical protein
VSDRITTRRSKNTEREREREREREMGRLEEKYGRCYRYPTYGMEYNHQITTFFFFFVVSLVISAELLCLYFWCMCAREREREEEPVLTEAIKREIEGV